MHSGYVVSNGLIPPNEGTLHKLLGRRFVHDSIEIGNGDILKEIEKLCYVEPEIPIDGTLPAGIDAIGILKR